MTRYPPTTVVRLAAAAMATRFEIVLGGGDPVRLRAVGEEALAAVAECEAALSPFRRGSAIARVNREAFERPVRVDPLTFELLEASVALHGATAGAFDPTVGPLMRALGFRGEPADRRELAAARAAIGMDGVELDAERLTVRFRRPGMELDPGAVGKGHALDLAAEIVREHRVDHALLHGGTSTVIAIGAPPTDVDGWQVAVGAEPDAPRAVLADAAMSVSAPHGRTAGGAGHVLDPRTKRPAGAAELAAVVTASARDADAWSTALLVSGGRGPLPAQGSALVRDRAGRWRARPAKAPCFRLHPEIPTPSLLA